jgi:hypothetical protein
MSSERMRREKRREESTKRFFVQQDSLREKRQRKNSNSLLGHDADHPPGGESGGRMRAADGRKSPEHFRANPQTVVAGKIIAHPLHVGSL